MNDQDEKLSRLLRQWRDIEPRPTFEPDVLRRIRLEVARPRSTDLQAWLPAWLGAPRRLAVAAAVPLALALAIGVASVWVLPPVDSRPPMPLGSLSVLERGTVAGNYVAMTEDRQP